MAKVRGRQALITGGARGLGRLLGVELARRGARVVLWDLDRDALGEAVAAVKAAGGGGEAICAGQRVDVTDVPAVKEAAAAALRDRGPIDILINNAGVVSGAPLLELQEADIRRTFEVNSLAPFWTTQALLPPMLERGEGHIVTIASAAGLIGIDKLSDYCASKHAAVGFDESLRMELRSRAPGVKTLVVCPIFIDTGMFEGVKTRLPGLMPILKQEEVARAVMDAIEAERPRLLLPPQVFVTYLARLLPVRLFDAAVDRLGINSFMSTFKGHG